MTFSVNIHKVYKYHLLGIAFLAAAYAVTVGCFELFGLDHMKGLTHQFALDQEQNLPTFFSAAALMVTATACFLCARASRKEGAFWNSMTLVFAFLAIDEFASIHELVATPFKDHIDADADYASAWAIPYAMGLMVLLGFIGRPFLRVDAATRTGLILAGCVFIIGAIGFERLGAEFLWSNSLLYSLTVLAEETLEMLGVALALRVILLHLTGHRSDLELNLTTKK